MPRWRAALDARRHRGRRGRAGTRWRADDLGFTLLADADHAVADAYGTWVEKSMYGNRYMGVARATFIIGPDGTVARVFPKVQPKKHDGLVLKALADGDTAMIEVTKPDLGPAARIVVAPFSKIRIVEPAHRR